MWSLVIKNKGYVQTSTWRWLSLVALLFASSVPAAPDIGLDCPQREFSLDEVASFVEMYRNNRADLPKPFADQESQLKRQRCLYVLFEYEKNKTGRSGNWQSFTFDFYGELMGFYAPEK